MAKLRQLGKEKLLTEAQRPNASLESTQVAKTLFAENNPADPRLQALKDSIINRAQDEIKAGATLPPQFQADLVRAGVQQGNQAGFATDARTVGGTIARALGIGGEQLKTARENQAVNLAGAATNITESRARILESIFPAVKTAEDTRRQQAAGEFGLGDATLPESGLTGREAANLQINRGNTLLKIRGKSGAISAQSALDTGKANAGYIGAGASFAGGLAGALSGGGGGGSLDYGSLLSKVQGSGGGGGGGGGGGRSDLYNQYGPQ